MNIILSRHGNTFAPDDKVVWAGASNDLPLVDSGIKQAERFANALMTGDIKPTAIYCGPLSRTHDYAQILIDKLALPVVLIVDWRLDEIDYGDWTGLTNEEVSAKYGEPALNAWNNESRWPKEGNWGDSEKLITDEVQAFAKHLTKMHEADETILVVSSNGRLRYFLTMIEGEFERRRASRSLKMKTGHISKLLYNNAAYSLDFWDQDPSVALPRADAVK